MPLEPPPPPPGPSWRDFHGANAGYVAEMLEKLGGDPGALDPRSRELLAALALDGAAPLPESDTADVRAAVGAANLAQAIREYGHLAARLDPLGSMPPGDPSLELAAHGLTEADLARLPASLVGGPIGERGGSALEAVAALREVYSGRIGYDYDHVRNAEERDWLRHAAEARTCCPPGDPQRERALLDRLTQVEAFEQFLQRSFPTKYRFSIEGLDLLVPMLDELIAGAAAEGLGHVLIGMAHRGRLNVLAHTLHKPYDQILEEFKDPLRIQELRHAIGWTTGDVKYHKGVRRVLGDGRDQGLVVTMPPNPSHLEAIDPVVVGMARAAGTDAGARGPARFDPRRTLPVLIHGDASFPGQGTVAETLNLSLLPGYWAGGSVHVIANNQLGFTTDVRDARSTLYASDVAKGYKVPIIHVNADDPPACLEAARTALAYLLRFRRDVMVDLVGYRRYGHNELDEPGFTQPLMYKAIRAHPTVRTLWADALAERGIVAAADAEAMARDRQEALQAALRAVEARGDSQRSPEPAPPTPRKGAGARARTAVPLTRLRALSDALGRYPEGFSFYSSRLEAALKARRAALDAPGEPRVDWATAEELAYASILADGVPIRLTGQDTERGTFSHRHAVLRDANTGEPFVPLQALPLAEAAFEVVNSPLSEAGALGFEYGYNVQAPDRLVIWEAQYGDFINGAQVVVDEFLVSAREKWGQTPSLVLLLPHGWEGAGPDHSSARLERFLQLTAKSNLRVASPTTTAQLFHLLRRQARLLAADPLPLVIASPKSLLRDAASFSAPRELSQGRWQTVIDDAAVDPAAVRRLVLCSGKFYYDLVASPYRPKHPEVAVARLEQLYPFPHRDLAPVLARYPKLQDMVWAQEEPKNMGAWEFASWRLERLVGRSIPVQYVGRRRGGSPAEGSLTAHKANQALILEHAFTGRFDATGRIPSEVHDGD